jgi:hypothetical protein
VSNTGHAALAARQRTNHETNQDQPGFAMICRFPAPSYASDGIAAPFCWNAIRFVAREYCPGSVTADRLRGNVADTARLPCGS